MIDLDQLQKLCDAATPGPWMIEPIQADGEKFIFINGGPRNGHPPGSKSCICLDAEGIAGDEGEYFMVQEDREFIAASRTALPALIAELRELRAVVEEMTVIIQCEIHAGRGEDWTDVYAELRNILKKAKVCEGDNECLTSTNCKSCAMRQRRDRGTRWTRRGAHNTTARTLERM